MKTTFTLLLGLIVVSAFSQWAEVDTVNGKYKSIYFFNDQIGFVTSTTFYKKTTDGGASWSVAPIPNPAEYGNHFYFLNPDTGFTGGYITHNGGDTWATLSGFSGPYCFTQNNQYGYAAAFMPFGNQAPTFKSANYGESWTTKAFTVPDPNTLNSGARDIHFADSANGIIAGMGGDVFYTRNGATSWTRKQPIDNSYNIMAVCMTSKDVAYCAAHPEFIGPFSSDNSTILRSTNGGDTWTPISTVYGTVKKMVFLDSLRGYLCNNGGFYSTYNAGTNWVLDTTVNNVTDFSVINNNRVFLLTWDSIFTKGGIYKKTISTGLQEVDLTTKGSIRLYPNPVVSGDTKIEVDNRLIGAEALITDATGKVIEAKKISSSITILQTSTFPAGIYFVRIAGEVIRFVKQ